MEERIKRFLEWAKSQNFHAGVSWFQDEYYISISHKDGKKICTSQDPDLDRALDNTLHILRNAGLA